MNYAEFLADLTTRGESQITLGLERMHAACARCEHPERAVPTVHIAGTNGKGSTGAFLAALLQSAGLRVGHYTSPHLCEFTERIAIAGVPIAPDACAASATWCLPRVADIPLSYFEWATLVAWRAFATAAPALDLLILETGLGGRLDGTNVVTPIAVALTPIARDHEAWLGDSLAAIAREKCGIIKSGVPVISAPQHPDAAQVIHETCSQQHATLQWAQPLSADVALGLPGAHQRVNAGVAWQIAQLLQQQGRCIVAQDALATAQWRGRCEWLRRDPDVLFDGAHNPHGMQALAEYVASMRGARTVTVAMACMADKNSAQLLAPWHGIAEQIVALPLNHPRALAPTALQQQAQQQGFASHITPLDIVLQRQAPDSLLVICGSLYLYAPAVTLIHV